MNREEWLSHVGKGHLLFEITSSAETLVRVRERKAGRIWYADENGPSNLRCVDARAGFSHDMTRRLIPRDGVRTTRRPPASAGFFKRDTF
jgi:hypothetical protein